MARRERRKFTDEFKAEVVALVRTSGKSIGQISRDLDLTETAVREWVKRAEVDGGTRDGLSTAAREEIAQLRRQVRLLEEERTILKKAAARRDYARQRQAVIVANAELRERELIKLASWAAALAETLRRRGVPEPSASLTAEVGIAVFKIAFERWVAEPGEPSLPRLISELLGELGTVTAGG